MYISVVLPCIFQMGYPQDLHIALSQWSVVSGQWSVVSRLYDDAMSDRDQAIKDN